MTTPRCDAVTPRHHRVATVCDLAPGHEGEHESARDWDFTGYPTRWSDPSPGEEAPAKADMTTEQMNDYINDYGAFPPVPGRPEAWYEPCRWCDEPAVCDDGAPDRGGPYCSNACRIDDQAYRATRPRPE